MTSLDPKSGFGLVRDDEVRRVQEAVAKGELSWCREDIEGLFEPFPNGDAGAFIEGQEIEAPREPDEDPCTESDNEEDRPSFPAGRIGRPVEAGTTSGPSPVIVCWYGVDTNTK